MDEIRKENLIQLIKSLEYTKEYAMKEINFLGLNDEAIRRTTVYPMAKVRPLMINEYPVMQFAYDGVFPIYDKTDWAYLNKIKHYYYLSTFDSYDYKKMMLPIFDKATIIFVQYFNDKRFGDLDNRNKKFIQDAIRLVQVIRDDISENVWNVSMGYYDKERNHIQVYVVEQENMADFLAYLQKNHEKLKLTSKEIPKLKEYEEAIIKYQAEQAKELEKKAKEKERRFEENKITIEGFETENKEKNDYDFW